MDLKKLEKMQDVFLKSYNAMVLKFKNETRLPELGPKDMTLVHSILCRTTSMLKINIMTFLYFGLHGVLDFQDFRKHILTDIEYFLDDAEKKFMESRENVIDFEKKRRERQS